MDLRLLTTFSTVAELGSVSAAAQALHVTQPALSRQVQQLERQLGVSLFHRHHRRLSLTAAGHTYLAAVREVLTSGKASFDSVAAFFDYLDLWTRAYRLAAAEGRCAAVHTG